MKKIFTKFFFITIFISVLIFSVYSNNALAETNSCPQNIDQLKVNDQCKIELIKLHPTQAEIGLYQVRYNIALLNLINAGKSKKYHDIDEYLQRKIIPVVIGSNNIIYMVDKHHSLRAIWEYFNHNPDQKVYIKVIQDWSKEPNFWQKMQENNYTYLGSDNHKITPEKLPKNIGDLINNNYRSAVSLAAKWTYLQEPKGEAKYFYQFKWGDCLQKLGFLLPSDIQLDEIYATAAFLHREDNQAKFPTVCHLDAPQEVGIEDFILDLETK